MLIIFASIQEVTREERSASIHLKGLVFCMLISGAFAVAIIDYHCFHIDSKHCVSVHSERRSKASLTCHKQGRLALGKRPCLSFCLSFFCLDVTAKKFACCRLKTRLFNGSEAN